MAMRKAAAWVPICQPSASRAIEPKTMPAAISATMVDGGEEEDLSCPLLAMSADDGEIVAVLPLPE